MADAAQDGVDGALGIDPVDIVAGRHDGPHPAVPHGEGALDHVLLGLVHEAGVPARRHEQFQLLGRVEAPLLAAAFEADRPHDGVAQRIQHRDPRPEQRQHRAERPDDPERGRLRALEREAFRHEFAEHDVEDRDERKGATHRDGLGTRRRPGPQQRQRGYDGARQGCLAGPAERQGRDRDAELSRREAVVEARDGTVQQTRGAVALGDEFLDPGPAHADEREFRRHEEAVGGDEPEHGQHLAGGDDDGLIHQ